MIVTSSSLIQSIAVLVLLRNIRQLSSLSLSMIPHASVIVCINGNGNEDALLHRILCNVPSIATTLQQFRNASRLVCGKINILRKAPASGSRLNLRCTPGLASQSSSMWAGGRTPRCGVVSFFSSVACGLLIHIYSKLQPQIVHNLLRRYLAIYRDHFRNPAQQPPLCVLYVPSNTGGTDTGVLGVKLDDSEETLFILCTAQKLVATL